MTDEKVKQKAKAELFAATCLPHSADVMTLHFAPVKEHNYWDRAVDALSAANLLHDPAEVARGKEALERCIALHKAREAGATCTCGEADDAAAIGRAELERRKPAPYCHVAVSVAAPTYRVIRKCDLAELADHLTEGQARAVAEVLNNRAAEEAK